MSGEVTTVRDRAGRTFELQRIQIEELPEYRARHGLVPIGRVTLGDGDDWPPMILYGPVAQLVEAPEAARWQAGQPGAESPGSNPGRPSEDGGDE